MIAIQNNLEATAHIARKKWLSSRIESIPEKKHLPPISDWAEENKYNPPGYTKLPGMHRRTTAPHMVEILEFFHPDNPYRWGSLLKSVQSTGSYHAEIAMAYHIAHGLGSIGFYTASQELAREISSSRISPLIDNTGLKSFVKPHSSRNARNRADSAYYKEFNAGIKMIINAYRVISGMKSHSLNLIILDEVDEAPADIKDQGDPIRIIEGRTITMQEYKIFELSTPTRMESSRIYKGYLAGDQRIYLVPCPLCGELSELKMMIGERPYGLTFDAEKKNGKRTMVPGTVRYICPGCRKPWRESEKQKAMVAGEWVPQAQPEDPLHVSWRVSGLMSPEPFLSWDRICNELVRCKFGKDVPEYKNFKINYLGQAWAKVEYNASWEQLKECACEYDLGGYIPGPMLLYGGVDIQGDRLEMAIVGVGRSMESWLIDYQIFNGRPSKEGVWRLLLEFVSNYLHPVLGRVLKVAVDIGWDPNRIYDASAHSRAQQAITSKPDLFFAVKGAGEFPGGEMIKRFRVTGQQINARFDIDTGRFKEILYERIKEPGPYSPHFPNSTCDIFGKRRPLSDHYYKSFCSEQLREISPGKSMWKKIYERNEVLDTYIYAVAAAYIAGVPQVDTEEFWQQYEKSTEKHLTQSK